ncbi:MAG TPA: hypothetical protein VLA71_14305 [Algoriphagus sp.]|nr:hypothetical protein [Algoriphagus sp.]
MILLDDADFGQFIKFGVGIPSPTMDNLAAEGLRQNGYRPAWIGKNHNTPALPRKN